MGGFLGLDVEGYGLLFLCACISRLQVDHEYPSISLSSGRTLGSNLLEGGRNTLSLVRVTLNAGMCDPPSPKCHGVQSTSIHMRGTSTSQV